MLRHGSISEMLDEWFKESAPYIGMITKDSNGEDWLRIFSQGEDSTTAGDTIDAIVIAACEALGVRDISVLPEYRLDDRETAEAYFAAFKEETYRFVVVDFDTTNEDDEESTEDE